MVPDIVFNVVRHMYGMFTFMEVHNYKCPCMYGITVMKGWRGDIYLNGDLTNEIFKYKISRGN